MLTQALSFHFTICEGELNIIVRTVGDVTILDLNGPLRIGHAEQTFRSFVDQAVNNGAKNVAINLAGVPMMDSSGIGALMYSHKTIKDHGGKLLFFAPPQMVKHTLKLVGLDRFLTIYEDEPSALAAS